jgi:hypothetical protein
MGNKRIILKPDGCYRKVCEKTEKYPVEINFCYCGRKRCCEGFRITSNKALCKIRTFRDKYKPVYDTDQIENEFDFENVEETTLPLCQTLQ